MQKANPHPADISVVIDRNGHVMILQGLHHQALYLLREHVPRLLANPQHAPMLVIPPFAATALACSMATEQVTSISLTRDLSLSTEFNLVVTSARGSKIAYYSDYETPIGPRALAKQGISVVVTPKAVTAVDTSGPNPSLTPVASIPNAQVPNYSMRFAADPGIIREAVQNVLYKSNSTQRYAT